MNDIAKIEPLNMPTKIGNISTTLLVDSGRACNILSRSFTPQVMESSPHDVWIQKRSARNSEHSQTNRSTEGKIQTPITSNGWTSNPANISVAVDGLKSLVGGSLFDHLGLALTQATSSQGNQVNNNSSWSEFKEYIAKISLSDLAF